MKGKTLKTALQLAACAFAAVFALQNPVQAFADAEPLYLSDVITASGSNEAEVKKKLKDAGYKVLDRNLLESDDNFVFIGYKTTTDSDKAITDLKAMNTNGNYSFPEYSKLLEEQHDSLERFSADMAVALKDYRANYRAGKLKAIIAHDDMNRFRDDDTGMLMGDLLLNEIREEMGDKAYKALSAEEKKKHADMTTLLMQGNSFYVKSVLSFLAMAQDTAEDSWTKRLESAKNVDDMANALCEERPTLSAPKAREELAKQYDADAKQLASLVQVMRAEVKAYNDSKAPKTGTPEEIEKYFAEHPEESESIWRSGGTQSILMQTLTFDGAPLGDLLLDEEYDFAEDASARAELYPILDVMTDGERRLLTYVSLEETVVNSVMDEKSWMQVKADLRKNAAKLPEVSMFEGVRREFFDAEGSRVALTDAAMRLERAGEKSWMEGMTSIGWGAYAGIAVASALISAVAGYAVAKSYLSLRDNFEARWNELDKITNQQLRYKNGTFATLDGINQTAQDYSTFVSKMKIGEKEFYRHSVTEQLSEMKEIQKKMESENLTSYAYDYYDPNLGDFGEVATGSATKEQIDTYIDYLEQQDKIYKQVNKEVAEKRALKDAADAQYEFSVLHIIGTVVCIVFALIAITSLAMMIYALVKEKEKNDPADSPNILVSRGNDENGEQQFVYYDVTKDLATGQNADLCGGTGSEWLALYSTCDRKAGDPILANTLEVTAGKTVPLGKKAMSLFGNTSAQIIADNARLYYNTETVAAVKAALPA